MSDPQVSVRPASGGDKRMLWHWRNDPATRAVSVSTEPIGWGEHQRWYADVLSSSERLLFVAVADAEPVGSIRFDAIDDDRQRWRVSIMVAHRFRGRGYGAATLTAGIDALRSGSPGAAVTAEVALSNGVSRRLFEGAGFLEIRRDDRFVTLERPDGRSADQRIQ